MPTVGRLPGPFLHDPSDANDKPAVWSLRGLMARLSASYALWQEDVLVELGAGDGENNFPLTRPTAVISSVLVFRSGIFERAQVWIDNAGVVWVTTSTPVLEETDLVARYQYTP